jgi:hypothetical protein
VMTPRSSCPGGESTPLQGANLRLIYEINNVTDTALGNLAGATIILARASAIDSLGHFWEAEAGQFWRAPKIVLIVSKFKAVQLRSISVWKT